MEFPMKWVLNASAEIASLKDNKLLRNFRFFSSGEGGASEPQFDVPESSPRRWFTAEDATRTTDDSSLLSSYLAGFSAVCFLTVRDIALSHFTSEPSPMGLILSSVGGTRIEAWMSPEAINRTGKFAAAVPPASSGNAASVLYNALVAPWNSVAVRAALWYQGESNALQVPRLAPGIDPVEYYAAMQAAMIADWRLKKRIGDFPFLLVQIAQSTAAGSSVSRSAFALTRWAQGLATPRPGGRTDISGMAVTVDLPGISRIGAIHPPDKAGVAHRLALQVLHVAYGLQRPLWTGPVPAGVTARWSTFPALSVEVEIRFEPGTAHGLRLSDVLSDPASNDSCRLCCAGAPPFEISLDQGWSWVNIPLAQTRVEMAAREPAVVLTFAPQSAGWRRGGRRGVAKVGVRYAWSDYVDCVLKNGAGLPMGTFVRWVAAETAGEGRWGGEAVEGGDAGRVRSEREESGVERRGHEAQVRRGGRREGRGAAGGGMGPVMGFNSWNFFHCNIDEHIVRAVADSFERTGLKKAGYEYINIDDCWMVERFPNGTVQADPVRFPSGMKALADYVHARGLKFGLYTAQGSRTCQSRPGAFRHEEADAAEYCAWGVDFLKVDACGGQGWPDVRTSWQRFRKAFDQCEARTGRATVLSVEYCETPAGCGEWVAGYAAMWRTTRDVQPSWSSIVSSVHQQDAMAAVARPGHFNDPDMLQVGNVGLSVEEQRSHFSLWAVVSAPLLTGTNPLTMPATTLAILTNPEVLAINQDLGQPGGLVQGTLVASEVAEGSAVVSEVWRKALSDGRSVGAVLLNRRASEGSVTALWRDLGTAGACAVRDLWRRKDVAAAAEEKFTAEKVPGHGAMFVKITCSAAVTVRAQPQRPRGEGVDRDGAAGPAARGGDSRAASRTSRGEDRGLGAAGASWGLPAEAAAAVV